MESPYVNLIETFCIVNDYEGVINVKTKTYLIETFCIVNVKKELSETDRIAI